MELTKEQIQLVKKSWLSLRGIKPELIADIFYSKLFAENPRLRKMFPNDMQGQYKKLMDMLSSIIMHLDNIDSFQEQLTAMAERHVGYGVKPAHYKLVGDALLWTLHKGLGKDWTTEVEAAWVVCYSTLADIMINSKKN